jgi:hypothetical protein
VKRVFWKKKSKENRYPNIQKMKNKKCLTFYTEIEKFQLDELCASAFSQGFT